MSDGTETTTQSGAAVKGADGQYRTPDGMILVPLERLQKKANALSDMEAQLTAAQQEVQALTLKAGTVDTLAQQLEEARAAQSSAETRYERYQGAVGSGLTDPDLIEFAEFKWGKLPEAERPGFSEWLGALKEDPTKAPAPLRSVWAEAPAAPAAAPSDGGAPPANQGAPAATPHAPSNGNEGVVGWTGSPSGVTPSAIRDMSDADYKANRTAILAQVTGG